MLVYLVHVIQVEYLEGLHPSISKVKSSLCMMLFILF